MNSVKLIGNVGKEVGVKEYDGGRMVTFSLATNETYLNKNKEEVNTTEWHSIVAWGQVAQKCETMVEKGKMISVEGKITYKQFKNKDNQLVKSTEIVALKVDEFVARENAPS